MELFFRLFSTGIPTSVLIGSIVIGLILTFIAFLWLKYNARNYIVAIWMLVYLFLILYTSVLRRESVSEYQINLIPFWSIGAINDGYIETLYEKLYNVLLYVPLGILASFYKAKELKYKSFLKVVLLGACTSVSIELLQLITKTGMCETDDVICNTFGTMLGAGLIFIGKMFINGK